MLRGNFGELHLVDFYGQNVGKSTIEMDPMGIDEYTSFSTRF